MSGELDDPIYKTFFVQAKVEAELRKKSNQTLANLLLDEVWADMDLSESKTTLVSVVIDRLQGEKAGDE